MIRIYIRVIILILLSFSTIAYAGYSHQINQDEGYASQDEGYASDKELDTELANADNRINGIITQINAILTNLDAKKKSIGNIIANKDKIIDCGVLDLFDNDIKTLKSTINSLKSEIKILDATIKTKKEDSKQVQEKIDKAKRKLSDSTTLLMIHNKAKDSYRKSLIKKSQKC